MAFGVSSPAYPARNEDEPMSTTSAETSSTLTGQNILSHNKEGRHTSSIVHHFESNLKAILKDQLLDQLLPMCLEDRPSAFITTCHKTSIKLFPFNRVPNMALDDAKRSRKRKESQDEDSFSKTYQDAGNLEMLSDEEAGGDVDSDDGQLEEFPGIDVASDSEQEEEDESDEQSDGESYDDDDNDDEEESDDSEIHLFPKSKNVISDITGKLKRIFPEIEPDYDSDSSTEDVSNSFIAFFNKTIYM